MLRFVEKMFLTAVLIYLLVTTVLHPVTGQQDSCAACNCPLASNQDLDNYITGRINEIMGNEPRKQKRDTRQE